MSSDRDIEARPVRSSSPPGYPTRGELWTAAQRSPGPLADFAQPDTPSRDRRRRKEVAGLASLLLAAGLTISDATAAPPTIPQKADTVATAVTTTQATQLRPNSRAIVAPIFEHGFGRGATGCVAANPPCFLSEDEAIQVIKEELGKHDLKLVPDIAQLGVSTAPRRREQLGTNETRIVPCNDRKKPLFLDGIDRLHHVGIEFVSFDEHYQLGGVRPETWIIHNDGGITVRSSTAFRYDVKDAALYLRREIERQCREPLYIGVFYDPIAGRPGNMDQNKRLLRQQAKDFVQWLKKQGAL